MILYNVHSNFIWVEPTKTKTEGKLILAHPRALQQMKTCRLTPQYQIVDNGISKAYKQAIIDFGMSYQLVPPDDHPPNIAEKAI
jgi:hypothetical protein